MTYRADCDLLGLDPSVFYHEPALIKERFRELALKLHPDLGGERDRFEAVRDAYTRLYNQAQVEHERCPQCKGRGWYMRNAGFTGLRQCCERCGGTGKRQ